MTDQEKKNLKPNANHHRSTYGDVNGFSPSVSFSTKFTNVNVHCIIYIHFIKFIFCINTTIVDNNVMR